MVNMLRSGAGIEERLVGTSRVHNGSSMEWWGLGIAEGVSKSVQKWKRNEDRKLAGSRIKFHADASFKTALL